MNSEVLIELLKIALGQMQPLSVTPQGNDWEKLLQMARKQALLGVISPALDKLDDSQRPGIKIYLSWMLAAEKIEKCNARAVERCRELYCILEKAGLRSCVLKGSAFAQYYDNPALRQSGDIDIWIEGGQGKVLENLRSRYRVGKVFYHHCSPRIFSDIEVEAHFMPSWMNSPVLNARLQEYYRAAAEEQFSNFDSGLGYCVPTPVFCCTHAFVHTFRHLYQEGVGLRQVMDCYEILKSLDAQRRQTVAEDLERLGLKKFGAAMMYVLKVVFGLEEQKFLFEPDGRNGEFLLQDILSSGNFGLHGKNAGGLYNSNFAVRSFSKAARIVKIARFCPREALWAPFFKLWQKCAYPK